MQDLGPATDDQVILAWLQAEIESERFRKKIVGDPPNRPLLARVRQVAHHGDLADGDENDFRRLIIGGMRGFGRGVGAFEGMANDVVWRCAHVSVAEVGAMLYINDGGWKTLAPTTLEVREGAGNVGDDPTADPNKHILAVAQAIRDTTPVPWYPELICLNRADGRISVIEGNVRATAYVIEAERLADGVDIYLGSSPSVANWYWR